MRNGLIKLVSAMVLGSMATAGCSSGGGTGGTGGSSSSGGTGGAGGNSSSGGTGGGNGGGSVTTLSGSKAVNALTTAEATQLCNDTYSYFGSSIPDATTCKWEGLLYAESSSAPSQSALQQGCTSHQTACLQGNPWANNAGCNDLPSTCAATVAQYSACIADEVAAFIQAVNGLSGCATLTSTGAIVDVQTANSPATCASLSDTCPDLYPPSPLNIQ